MLPRIESYPAPLLQSENALKNLGASAVSDVLSRTDSFIEQRPYQNDCLQVLTNVRAQGETKALIHMATGLGKTTVAAKDVENYLQAKPAAKVLFLCHQNEILDQARTRFEQVLGGNGFSYGTFNGQSKDMHEVTCLFASMQTMRDWKDAFYPHEFDYIVVDESHHSKAETYEPVINYFQPAFMAGYTGTPDREDLKDIREIFGQEVYSKPLTAALAEGLLAVPDYRVILDNIQEGVLDEQIDANLAELNRILFIPKRDEEIAQIVLEKTAAIKEPRTMIFCPSISHAKRMALLLPDAKAYHSKQSPKERQQLLSNFRNGITNTLLTVDMFNEGIDIPDANVVVFLRSTNSRTVFLQQLGRGLRKTANKDSVLVLDFVANCDRLLMLEDVLHETMQLARAQKHDEIASDDIERDISEARELQLGSFEFTETSRRIMQLIHDAVDMKTRLRKWNMLDSITYYRGLCETTGRTANIVDIVHAGKEPGNPGYQLLVRDFNSSIVQLRRACGMKESLRNFWKGWTAADSVEYYNALSEILGRSASVNDINAACARGEGPGINFLVKRYEGSIAKLKEAAGHAVNTKGRTWNDEMSIAYYQELAKELGRTPTEKDIRSASKDGRGPSPTLLLKNFGSLRSLRAASEIAAADSRNWTESDFVDYYKQLSEALGHPATVEEVNEAYKQGNGPHLGAFYKRGLRLPYIRERAGFAIPIPYTKWRPEQAETYLQNLHKTLGRIATQRDIETAGRASNGPSARTLQKILQQND
ncbi:MAG: DEAD/DEAH box helicase family protein [Patescibacteria group bacterium]|nr:DEAD/DEAH box helicase family protein [Patescibacteria group bacterium]